MGKAPMCQPPRLIAVLLLEIVLAAMLAMAPAWVWPAEAQTFTGWSVQKTDKVMVLTSPMTSAGNVKYAQHYAAPYGGSFMGWFQTEVDRSVGAMPGLVRRSDIETEEVPNSDGGTRTLWVAALVARRDDGLEVRTLICGYRTVDGKAQMMRVVHPELMPADDPHYAAAFEHVLAMSQAGRGVTPSASPQAAEAPPAPPATIGSGAGSAGGAGAGADGGAGASGATGGSPFWTVRNFANSSHETNRGISLVSPCGDGAPIFGAVYQRYYTGMFTLSAVVEDEVRYQINRWTGGQGGTYQPMRNEGGFTTVIGNFSTQDGAFVAWFAVRADGNYIQRAYMVAPVALANDPRFAAARQSALQIMAVDGRPMISDDGAIPSGPAGQVEAVLKMPGFALSGNEVPLVGAPIEIALWKNGAALDGRSKTPGLWSRIPGGYAVAFFGSLAQGTSTVVHIAETCKSGTVTNLSPPSLLPRVNSGGTDCRTQVIETGLSAVQDCTLVGGQKQCTTKYVNSKNSFNFCY